MLTTPRFTRFALLFLLTSTAVAGCGGANDSNGPTSSEDDLSKTPPFTDEASGKPKTFDGISLRLFAAPDALTGGPLASMSKNESYAYGAWTARLAAADLAKLKADLQLLGHFAEEMDGLGGTPKAEIKIAPVDRASAATAFGKYVIAPSAPLHVAVASLLSAPTEAVYVATYGSDWTNSAIIAVTVSGEVRVIYAIGDV